MQPYATTVARRPNNPKVADSQTKWLKLAEFVKFPNILAELRFFPLNGYFVCKR